MKEYKAIFLDRDNTITRFNPEKRKLLSNQIMKWSGKEYGITYDEMMHLLNKAGYPEGG